MSGAARTVWVTGAASGMGAAHARRFAEPVTREKNFW
jgi:NAD(P)-dependent dehydrogenase (short-subunit alcohol dehydrogenase family)